MPCVCGLEPSTEECCGRYVTGGEKAPTAEALMRSRYAAYVLGELDYVMGSHDPDTIDGVDRDGAADWSKQAEWETLIIHETDKGGPDDDEGVVEFTARYDMDGREINHRERAVFKKINGSWMYHDGEMVKAKPMVRDTPKVGRNEPCPCGSGKKYKKCCGK